MYEVEVDVEVEVEHDEIAKSLNNESKLWMVLMCDFFLANWCSPLIGLSDYPGCRVRMVIGSFRVLGT